MDHAARVAWLRERLDQAPLPELRRRLVEEGEPAEAVDAAVAELFPGDAGARRKAVLRGGLIGAAAGVLAWLAAFLLYRR